MMPNRTTIQTFAVAGFGVAIFEIFALPLPWLLGPMFSCLAAALAGMPMQGAPFASESMRTVLGLAVGAAVTPALFGRLDTMAASLALIPLLVLVIGLVGYPYFRVVCGFDRATSYYSAMPGGLQDMLIFGEEAGGNPRSLSLVHATRVLLIVSILPFIMTHAMDLTLSHPPGEPVRDLPLNEIILMIVLAAVGWKGGKAIGLFGASILGPLILAAAASLMDLMHHRPPAEAILAAQFFIGLGVGVKYAGITVGELKRVVLAAVGYSAILAVLSAIFTLFIVRLGIAPPAEALLAFAPGGQAEMAVLAILTGTDAAFVVTHHLLRILLVILGAPIVGRFLRQPDT